MSLNIKITSDEHDLLRRTEHSLDSLYEWLEKCVGEADTDLRQIIQDKIRTLIKRLDKLLNK